MLRILPVIFIAALPICSLAQDQKDDSLHLKLKQVYAEVDSLFSRVDSTSAIDLIESFLTKRAPKDTSKLLVRLGYNSNVSAMNQTLGIRQFGISPGVSYYHRSGLYGDVSTYWSKQFLPPVYLTVFSAGYLKAASKSYLFNLEYSYFLYPNNGADVSAPYTNSINITNQFDLKPFQFKVDYHYYFGSQTAHRILPAIGCVFEKKHWGKMDRFLFSPAFGILFGTESTQQYVPLVLTTQQALDRIKTGGSLYKTETTTVFGLMNYSLTLPLSVRVKHWVYQVSYTYNVPRSLPNEELGLSNTGYISASVARYIRLK